ncbi:MAG: DUF4402 domain-containing protein [Sphingopyxis sp.]
MKLRFLPVFFLCLAAPSAASAQCVLCGQQKSGSIPTSPNADTPLRIDIETQLDMGRVAAGTGGGEVALDPVTGVRRVSGDVRDLGGFAVTGTVTVRGEPGAEVRVFLPASVDLESGSGGTARVVGLATDLGAAPRLGPDGRLQFRFGGRLQVSGATGGDYRGRIPVTVEYQ